MDAKIKKAKKEGKVVNLVTGNIIKVATAKGIVRSKKGYKYSADHNVVGVSSSPEYKRYTKGTKTVRDTKPKSTSKSKPKDDLTIKLGNSYGRAGVRYVKHARIGKKYAVYDRRKLTKKGLLAYARKNDIEGVSSSWSKEKLLKYIDKEEDGETSIDLLELRKAMMKKRITVDPLLGSNKLARVYMTAIRNSTLKPKKKPCDTGM